MNISLADGSSVMLRAAHSFRGDPWEDFVYIKEAGEGRAGSWWLGRLLAFFRGSADADVPVTVVQPYTAAPASRRRSVDPSILAWSCYVMDNARSILCVPASQIWDTAFTAPANLPDRGMHQEDEEDCSKIFLLDKSLYYPCSPTCRQKEVASRTRGGRRTRAREEPDEVYWTKRPAR